MGGPSNRLGQHWATWGNTLKGRGSMGQHVAVWGSMEQHGKTLNRAVAVLGNTLKALEAWGSTLKG